MSSDLRGRVWLALNCLPRTTPRKLPPFTSMARDAGIDPTLLIRILKGERRNLTPQTLANVAAFLHVDPGWLSFGHGQAPEPVFPLLDIEERYPISETHPSAPAETQDGDREPGTPVPMTMVAGSTPPPSPPSRTHLSPQAVAEASRDAALSYARAMNLPEEAIRAVAREELVSYRPDEWFARVVVVAADLRIGRVVPRRK